MKIDNISARLASIRANPVEKHEPLLQKGCVISAKNSQDIGDVQVVRRIGLGTHAEVYEVETSGKTFALKVEKPIKQAYGVLEREIATLRMLSHLNCVPRVLGEFSVDIDSSECFSFGIEQFNASMSLLKHVRPLEEDMAIIFPYLAQEMFNCVSSIHEVGILHRDIKPSNFMFKLNEQGTLRVVLIDFGSSIVAGQANETEFRGTGAYLPIDYDVWESTKMDDYWALAYTLLDISIGGGLPWRSISARSPEGREEIRKQKLAFLNEEMPSFMSMIFQQLQSNFIPSISTSFSHDPERIVHIMGNLLRPKDSALGLLSNTLPSIVPVYFAFSPPPDSREFSATLSTFRARTSHSICVTQLLQGECWFPHCPLRHYERGGIVEAAVERRYRQQNRPCVFHLLTGKCKTKNCSQVHFTDSDVATIYS